MPWDIAPNIVTTFVRAGYPGDALIALGMIMFGFTYGAHRAIRIGGRIKSAIDKRKGGGDGERMG